MLDLSDEELEHAYLFDFRVRNALGKETLGDNICPKTFNNFRRRLLEYEDETGRDLLHEVFVEHRDYLQDEFDIDTNTQRMDSTFIDGNIKQLSRLDLIALEGKQLRDVLEDLDRKYIDVEVEVEFKRGPYNETRSLDTKRFRVVGVRDEDADDYHLYILIPKSILGFDAVMGV